MAYVLANTANKMSFYKFERLSSEFELVDTLDLKIVPQFEKKIDAKLAAQILGLRTWRYVKI